MAVLTLERTMRLHRFCVQWDSTCGSSRAPLPDPTPCAQPHRSDFEFRAGCAGLKAGST